MGNRFPRPLVLHSLSMFTCSSIIDPIIWFDRAKAVLKNAAVCGTEFTEAQGVAAVMDRAEAGLVIASWFNTLGEETTAEGMLFERAFRKRFGISKTIESAGGKLQNIKSSKFNNFDAFYAEFVDLVAIVGAARSHRDVVSNFLEALPSNVKTLVLLKAGIDDEVFRAPLDDLFHCAKKLSELVPQNSGYTPVVNLVTQEDEVGNDQVLAVQSGGCTRCNSAWHSVKDCKSGGQRCFRCGKEGHIAVECTLKEVRSCFICGEKGHVSFNCPRGDNRNHRGGPMNWPSHRGGVGMSSRFPDDRRVLAAPGGEFGRTGSLTEAANSQRRFC